MIRELAETKRYALEREGTPENLYDESIVGLPIGVGDPLKSPNKGRSMKDMSQEVGPPRHSNGPDRLNQMKSRSKGLRDRARSLENRSRNKLKSLEREIESLKG